LIRFPLELLLVSRILAATLFHRSFPSLLTTDLTHALSLFFLTQCTIADVLKYHVVPGKYTSAQIAGDLKTLQGNSLTYQRKFRKTFVDDAIVGQEDNFVRFIFYIDC
jgi:hypothetical protein